MKTAQPKKKIHKPKIQDLFLESKLSQFSYTHQLFERSVGTSVPLLFLLLPSTYPFMYSPHAYISLEKGMATHSSILAWSILAMDRGTWGATVHGDTKSWTGLSD